MKVAALCWLFKWAPRHTHPLGTKIRVVNSLMSKHKRLQEVILQTGAIHNERQATDVFLTTNNFLYCPQKHTMRKHHRSNMQSCNVTEVINTHIQLTFAASHSLCSHPHGADWKWILKRNGRWQL